MSRERSAEKGPLQPSRGGAVAQALPQVLLVDDSAAIVAFEAAALSGLYALSTASDGAAALQRIRDVRPALVLLDLSMPIMDGDRVVEAVRADTSLDDVAIVIVSTERERAQALLKLGANGFLPKPLKADELRATVARVLEEVARRQASATVPILPLRIGRVELAVNVERVLAVSLMPRTIPLPAGPPFIKEMLDVHGEPVALFDLAERLGEPHELSRVDRKLVLMRAGDRVIAFAVDEVREPMLVPRSEVVLRASFAGGEHEPLRAVLEGVVRRPEAPLPLLDAAALLSPAAVEFIASGVRAAAHLAP